MIRLLWSFWFGLTYTYAESVPESKIRTIILHVDDYTGNFKDNRNAGREGKPSPAKILCMDVSMGIE